VRLNEVVFDGSLPVDGYGQGFFRIGGAVYQGAVLVTPAGVLPWGGLIDIASLTALAGTVDVLFVGMGAEIAHLPDGLRTAMDAVGIGAEPMASPAACRTYNVLLSEGRRVALAAIPV
jgi:uncharacterized protein